MREIYVSAGSDIERTIEKAIKDAAVNGPGEFDFNGVKVQVEGNSDANLIYREWERGMLRPSDTFTVKAHPAYPLSEEQVAEDVKLYAAQRKRERERREAYQREQETAAVKLKAALETAPFLSLKDPDGWKECVNNNSDPYGGACVRFAENWGRLMQARLEQGAKIGDIADECCSIADGPEGITGFMYGAAVSILSHVWEHGEELRHWHNLKTQIGTEGEKANESGGTLNPAVLRFG
jgi:hypothetical protein